MYKANQEALFQATNQGLVNIRQSEINYYLSVNSAIGTQAALIGGFTYTITVAASVHVIMNTMLLQILGPGLALNGPIGSMARDAVDDDDDDEPTLAKFQQPRGSLAHSNSTSVDNRPAPLTSQKSVAASVFNVQSSTTPVSISSKPVKKEKKSKKLKMSGIYDWFKPTEKEIRENSVEIDQYLAEELSKQLAMSAKDIAMEGYITKRGIARAEFLKDPWSRRYFVLNHRGHLSYYKNRQDYREDPQSRIKGRPMDLDDYFISVSTAANIDDNASTTFTSSATGAQSSPLFQINMKPKDDDEGRLWMLRCDTEEQMNKWLHAMTLVSPSSFLPPSPGDTDNV
eukprot:gene37347-46081_t